MSKKDAKVSPGQSNAEKVVIRGSQDFRHDLFKSDVKNFLKNTSFKKGVVSIVELAHTHVFHSHNSQGREQEYTSTVGGHFHKIRRFTDAQGNIRVECGPPLMYKQKKRPSGSKRVLTAVEWHNADAEDNSDQAARIVDKHTHVFEYLGSEYLNAAKVRSLQQKTQAVVGAALEQGGGSSREADQNPEDQGGGDDLQDVSGDGDSD